MDQNNLNLCPRHIDSLQFTRITSRCDACYRDDNKQGYKCSECYFFLHQECINVYIYSRHKHPLKLTKIQSFAIVCCLCRKYHIILYQCSQCAFCICMPCARLPLTFKRTKIHEHELLQIPIELSFTCDACGLHSRECPCLCLQCYFVIHRECIFLPLVISINRHDHRICRVFSLGYGKWICGVCYENVNGEYGAYCCSVCSYVSHSKCATNRKIWDGRELVGVPEQGVIKPFEVIDQNLIKYFSHEHYLKASKLSSKLEEPRENCYACTLPFDSEWCYKCTQCNFILHKACANLPLTKKHVVNSGKFILVTNPINLFSCVVCKRYCNGFSYNLEHFPNFRMDVRCASIISGTIYESHPHRLFVPLVIGIFEVCNGCYLDNLVFLNCSDKDNCGGYTLCFKCATLPRKVKHKYDDHYLVLCYGDKNVNVTYYCGICEDETSSKSWFYKCDKCNSTFHTECVFKNLIHSVPEFNLEIDGLGSFNLLPNNSLSRPICFKCKIRCVGAFVFYSKDKNRFICSTCALKFI